nr:hypothetical protein CFP56_11838 [Quercus suber]
MAFTVLTRMCIGIRSSVIKTIQLQSRIPAPCSDDNIPNSTPRRAQTASGPPPPARLRSQLGFHLRLLRVQRRQERGQDTHLLDAVLHQPLADLARHEVAHMDRDALDIAEPEARAHATAVGLPFDQMQHVARRQVALFAVVPDGGAATDGGAVAGARELGRPVGAEVLAGALERDAQLGARAPDHLLDQMVPAHVLARRALPVARDVVARVPQLVLRRRADPPEPPVEHRRRHVLHVHARRDAQQPVAGHPEARLHRVVVVRQQLLGVVHREHLQRGRGHAEDAAERRPRHPRDLREPQQLRHGSRACGFPRGGGVGLDAPAYFRFAFLSPKNPRDSEVIAFSKNMLRACRGY